MGDKEKHKNMEEINQEIKEEIMDEVTNETKQETQGEAKEGENVEMKEKDEANNDENSELVKLKEELEEKKKKCDEYYEALQRSVAEFDNYRKRTLRERESLYVDAVCDTVLQILPVLDNLERAIAACKESTDSSKLLEGVEMIYKQFNDTLLKLGVEEIKSVGTTFDPELHNAVMHVEDEQVGENEIVEEFQKGYKLKNKVIRHSMVKVAN